ncbi:hypothetical protein ES703_55136 [subsurface metagenome]
MKLKALIACEFSGIVRDAFTKAGLDATSCDLLPTESPGKHYQGNVFDIINDGWDVLIAFPPCQYLTYAANSVWFDPGRAQLRLKALQFFLDLWEAPIDHICMENPAGIVHSVIAPYTQIIHPYYFGDPEMKRTYLWLKNLPPLTHAPEKTLFYAKTHTGKPAPVRIQPCGKPVRFVASRNTKSTRAKLRSIFFPSVAKAMAEQWSYYLQKK